MTGVTGPVPGERALIRAAAAGDEAAFRVLVERHTPSMLRYARRLVADPADAEDAVQEALIGVWRGLDGFRGDASLRTWLFTLTSRRATDLARRAARRPPVVVVGPERLSDVAVRGESTADPFSDAVAADLVVALDAALRELPVGQRAVWLLREVERLSYEQIAVVVGTSVTVVRGRLARARPALAERMAAWR